MSGEGSGYGVVVRPKGGEGGSRHVREKMPSQKSDIWRGGLTVRGEAYGRV